MRAFAAIDVGSNAARLKIVRVHANGATEALYAARAPIRPGESVFKTGEMSETAVQQLCATLRGFVRCSAPHAATLRAVATAPLREARNREAVLRRIRASTGLLLEVLTADDEARLVCLGVLTGARHDVESL